MWDLYLGVMLLPLVIFPFVHYALNADLMWALLAMMLIYTLGFAGFRWLKKHVTQPRLGMIQPGPSRRKKLHTLRMVGAVAVVSVIALVLLTVFANPLTQITVFGISLETVILGIPLDVLEIYFSGDYRRWAGRLAARLSPPSAVRHSARDSHPGGQRLFLRERLDAVHQLYGAAGNRHRVSLPGALSQAVSIAADGGIR